tara:strand:- start:3267 stop:3533 length:267 start_codon:yes stop_codon:yes gene_type:complete
MNEEVKTQPTQEDIINDLTSKLKYAQKLINNMQNKLNESTGIAIQLEAKLQLAEEDHIGIKKQLEVYGMEASKVSPAVLAKKEAEEIK